jgi:hypothetical protein
MACPTSPTGPRHPFSHAASDRIQCREHNEVHRVLQSTPVIRGSNMSTKQQSRRSDKILREFLGLYFMVIDINGVAMVLSGFKYLGYAYSPSNPTSSCSIGGHTSTR